MIRSRLRTFLSTLGPGMLLAATGVGAGDLATATFSGTQLGLSVLWAVVLGGILKYTLNEGLARWQLATGTTFVQGAVTYLSKAVGWVFVPYLLLWSFFVGSALVGACGVALHAAVPVFDDPTVGKQVFGTLSGLAGLAIVRAGSFQSFERLMSGLVGLMTIAVLISVAMLWPGWGAVGAGLFNPSIPDADGQGVAWTVALMGGVGGTVTVLCYGYWIAERQRTGLQSLKVSRWDLAAGYAVTVIFGLGMVILGSGISVEGRGADLLVRVADLLSAETGPTGRVIFLAGAVAAVFSSLLGVWQAVPYLAADVWYGLRATRPIVTGLRETSTYRRYQIALAIVPLAGLFLSFRTAQLLYGLVGAAFMPLLALALLILNSQRPLLGTARNGWLATVILLGTMAFFVWAALM